MIFFESENAPYRDDHVDFLARFGGNNFTDFLKKQDCCFDFSTVKGLYEDDKDFPDDLELQEGCCHFANPFYSNFLCIEQSTGIIYREEVDETGNPVLNEIVWCDIKSLLFMSSLYYLEKIGTRLSVEEKLLNETILSFQKENEAYILNVPSPYMAYYLKEDMFYSLSKDSYFLITTKLNPIFCEQLVDKRMSL